MVRKTNKQLAQELAEALEKNKELEYDLGRKADTISAFSIEVATFKQELAEALEKVDNATGFISELLQESVQRFNKIAELEKQNKNLSAEVAKYKKLLGKQLEISTELNE